MKSIEFKISLPTDNGFWGRECTRCNKYYKIQHEWIKDELFCPYCGELQKNDNLWTKEQNRAVKKIVDKIAIRYVEDELEKAFKEVFSGSNSITYTPGEKTRIPKLKKHLEKDVDSEIECSKCHTPFQVFGVFGFCPGCKEDSILIYESNLIILINEIEDAEDKIRKLRHAYNDLVSTFEAYCKSVSNKFGLGKANFQNLESTKDLFQKHNVNIYEGISDDQIIDIIRVFEKRHAYQHSKGLISELYVTKVPVDRELLNTKANLSKSEFLNGIEILKLILKNITNKYGI